MASLSDRCDGGFPAGNSKSIKVGSYPSFLRKFITPREAIEYVENYNRDVIPEYPTAEEQVREQREGDTADSPKEKDQKPTNGSESAQHAEDADAPPGRFLRPMMIYRTDTPQRFEVSHPIEYVHWLYGKQLVKIACTLLSEPSFYIHCVTEGRMHSPGPDRSVRGANDRLASLHSAVVIFGGAWTWSLVFEGASWMAPRIYT